MPSRAPMVTTPVPPTPGTRMLYERSITGVAGSGMSASIFSKDSVAVWGLRTLAPSAVTKLGQKPFRQEQSLLHEDWLMRRLLPIGVSTGSTERQFDFTPQSPQPSHTASLMKTRRSGSG